MNKREYRNGLICGIAGSVLTMIGDFLIGANPAADAPTGIDIIDLYGDCLRNSDLRMIIGGMLGVIGMPLTGIGYYRIYEAFIRKQGVVPAFLYKTATLACIALGGAGAHMSCVVIPLLYRKQERHDLVSKIGNGVSVLAEEKYYSHIDRKGLSFITKVSMNVSDRKDMVRMIHLRL